jgi:two-component system chemotaxis sensor kinase CheA
MAEDRYKYFRIEARELLEGLTRGILELEKAEVRKPVIDRLLRFAHTLKGASRVVKLPRITEHAHALEEILAPYRDGQRPMPTEQINGLYKLLDGMAAEIATIDAPPEGKAEALAPALPDPVLETVRVDVGEVDTMLEGVAEAMTHVAALRGTSTLLGRAGHLAQLLSEQLSPRRAVELNRVGANAALAKAYPLIEELRDSLRGVDRNISSRVEQAGGELLQVRDAASRLRLHPVSSVFGALERAARDAADALDRKVVFSASGGEIRVDAPVLVAVRDALLHVIRNAVTHGVETEAERVAVGKPAGGRLELTVERRGNRAVFSCRDDGRGVDFVALRRAARKRGSMSAEQADALGSEEIVELMLKGGLTTTRTVTQLSGRGIGLDVVREAAQRLNGDVKLHSEPGRGTSVEIGVPISLASLPVLVMQAAGQLASLPLDAVRATLRLRDTEIAKTSDGDSIVHEERLVPFKALAEVLNPGALAATRATWSVVVVESGSARLALGVDALLGTATSVVKPLASWMDVDPVVHGASFDSDGNPQIVLDPAELLSPARAVKRIRAQPASAPRLPVLVIDDSLTTRMLEQSILESAGYTVDVATSAEEALHKATDNRYSLFVVDVEMPGMDGFEFVARTRQDTVLSHIPAILVTSRGSAEDRLRGKESGAHAYIVKGEFDQTYLLQTIRELIG